MGREGVRSMAKCLAPGNFDEAIYNPWVFPALISDDLCRKCPPAFILTCEFDIELRGSKETATVYRRNRNLIGIGIVKGSDHGHYLCHKHPRTDAWYKAFADVAK